MSTQSDEFVGYVEMERSEFEERLCDMGFDEFDPFYHICTREHNSWRSTEDGWQLHVLTFDGHHETKEFSRARTYIFAHWEYKPENHPLWYLRGIEQSTVKGVNRMRTKLNLASISYYNDRRVQ